MATQIADSNRRRHQRFKPENGVFVNVSSNLGKIIDISKGGMAFQYFNWESEPHLQSTLDISFKGKEVLTQIPIRLLSDNEITSQQYSSLVKMKECRVQFLNMTIEQEAGLESFLNQCGFGAES